VPGADDDNRRRLQDQAGGIFPGAKVVTSGPGLRQRLRVEPIRWSAEREREFSQRLVLYNTGIQRMAKNLLRQVVARYLAREGETVQALHGIKTLATEMAFAMRDGEWTIWAICSIGNWRLNQILDPHTTNAPIDNLLARVRPFVSAPSWLARAAEAILSSSLATRRRLPLCEGSWARWSPPPSRNKGCAFARAPR